MSNNQDNDKIFNDYMNGDSEISRRYRDESNEEPPKHLIDATQNLIEGMMDADKKMAVYKPRKEWYVPLSLVAVLVMSFSIIFNIPNEVNDLDRYVSEVLTRPGGRIEPLPEIKTYDSYAYQSAEQDARDPFRLFYDKDEQELIEEQDSSLTNEMEDVIRHRNKEELEQFELDSLRMVGIMENENNKWGLIQSPDGVVHRIKVGNYMGRNTGKVLNVFEDRIEIREIVRNSQGRWEERLTGIALSDYYDAKEIESRQK